MGSSTSRKISECFLLLVFSVACSSASNQWVDPVANIEASMTGFDPIMSNPYTRPDPGARNKIFEPVRVSERVFGKLDLNSFVGKAQEDTFCDMEFASKTVMNLNEYNDIKKSSYSYAYGASESSSHFSFKSNSGQGQAYQGDEATVQSFFDATAGEVVHVQAQCIVYSTSISHFEEPVFTESFISGLRALNKAAYSSKDDNETFIEFLNDYGTHYMKSVQMGARLVFIKGFASRATSQLEADQRSQCVTNAAYDSSGRSGRRNSHDSSFAEMSKQCEGTTTANGTQNINEVELAESIFIGPLPTDSFSLWVDDVIKRPVPISFQLEKISSLFRDEWLNTIPVDEKNASGETLNATAIFNYFDEKSYIYCQIMLGEECQNTTVCGFSNICPTGTVCEEDESSSLGYQCFPTYGGTIFAGGYNPTPFSSVESLGTYELPPLPNQICNTSLTTIGSSLYLTGGVIDGVISSSIYELDLFTIAPSWIQTLSLPEVVNAHTTVAVSSNLWTVYMSTLYDLDTRSKRIMTYYLPFNVTSDHCAVSNATHSFILGAGPEYDEVWVNSEALNPAKWHKVKKLTGSWRGFGCLWFKDEIFLTGGREPMLNNAIALNITSNEVTVLDSLHVGRQEHKMFVLEGKPAVVGGCDDTCSMFFSSIETYDSHLKNWTVDSRYLRESRSGFGLAQLPQ